MSAADRARRTGFLARLCRLVCCLGAVLAGVPAHAQDDSGRAPNVLFIILDDLNDYTGFLGGHPQTLTPHMDALARRSASFTDAYPTLPICAPSRASLFTGIQPFRSRSLSFDEWFHNERLRNSNTLMEYFQLNGYRTLGSGKILHHNVGYLWDEFHDKVDYGPVWLDGGERMAHPSVPRPFGDQGHVDGSFGPLSAAGVLDEEGLPYTGWWSVPHRRPVRYVSETDRDLLPDEISAQWAARRLAEIAAEDNSQPFFMAVGILRPHTPLHVPPSYFDRLPPADEIVIPNYDPADLEDTWYRAVFDDKNRGIQMFDALAASYAHVEDGLREFIRAYLASVAFADDQVETILAALEATPLADNTIVVLTSDHGWTHGEKNVLFKNNLWQSGSRVPLLIYRPGHDAQVLDAPVSLIDLYPTLRELGDLEGDTRKNRRGLRIDGTSLVRYMDEGEVAAPGSALLMLKATNAMGQGSNRPGDQHYSLVTRDWRYIRYNTGQEELYDRRADPLERHNLALQPGNAKRLENLRAQLHAKLEGS